MSDTIRCVQDYDRLYEVKVVGEKQMDKSPIDHWHTKYELVLVTEGHGEHVVNGKKHHISTGDVFIVSPADFHHYFSNDDIRLKAVRINFSNAFYFYYLNPNCRFESFPVTAKLPPEDLDKAKQPQLSQATARPEVRENFWLEYETKGVRTLLKKYGGVKCESFKTVLYKLKKKILK